ncbi:MAG: hypothetical protein OEN01_10295, partial [Candidatus Krumholzibacteria bacterium]|nr:hypothetical protein [Candidatus Krumholzibacteria bacterium]
MSPGKGTADEAAALVLSGNRASDKAYRHWNQGIAAADTTGYEFPEEEEEKHLIRRVALWVVVSGFVAFFIIKVFLQGDTDTPEPE